MHTSQRRKESGRFFWYQRQQGSGRKLKLGSQAQTYIWMK